MNFQKYRHEVISLLLKILQRMDFTLLLRVYWALFFFTSPDQSLPPHLELRLFILNSLSSILNMPYMPHHLYPGCFLYLYFLTFSHLPLPGYLLFISLVSFQPSFPPGNLFWLFLSPLMLGWVALPHRDISGERLAGQFPEHQSITRNVMK